MNNAYEEIEKIEKENNIIYLELLSENEKISLIRTTLKDFESFNKDLSDKVTVALMEHFGLESYEITDLKKFSYNSYNGVCKLKCLINEHEYHITLMTLHVY